MISAFAMPRGLQIPVIICGCIANAPELGTGGNAPELMHPNWLNWAGCTRTGIAFDYEKKSHRGGGLESLLSDSNQRPRDYKSRALAN